MEKTFGKSDIEKKLGAAEKHDKTHTISGFGYCIECGREKQPKE